MNFNKLPETQNGLRGKYEQLKRDHEQLVQELNKKLAEMVSQANTTAELLEVLVELVGQDEVLGTLEAKRKTKRDTYEAEQAAQVKLLVEQSVLLPQETIDNQSTIVTSETYKDGKVTREQYVMSKVTNQEILTQLLGKKVGDTLPVGDVTVEIREIYAFDKARADLLLKEASAQAEAAPVAAEPTPAPVEA